jgi:signal transduction histidine kinase
VSLARPRLRLPGSLRVRLTLAFAAIIVVTLLLAGSAFVFILRDYQIRREVNRVAELTIPFSNQVRSLELLGGTTQEIVDFLERQAEDLDVRVVLADNRGNVFFDTEDTLVGRRLDIQNPPRFGIQRRVRQASVESPDGELTFMVSPNINPQAPQATPTPPGASLGERFLGRPSAYTVGLSVPRQSIGTAWLELLPRLSLAALAALLLSVGLAWPLAASIARPLAGMTQAAEAMAQGRLDQQIPVRGRDEVGRLAQAFNTMAREVSASQRTLRDFLANVSHDLRTPLTSIQGFSQALTDGTLAEPDELAEAGRIINQEAARMSRLVDDLLFLSKMESGQAAFERRLLDLTGLVAARVEAFARRAAERNLTLRWQPSPTPLIEADQTSLERVVDNLLDNALRYTPAGGTVTVGVESQGTESTNLVGLGFPRPAVPPDPVNGSSIVDGPAIGRGDPAPSTSHYCLVWVHNTGSTIPPDDLPRVFERFYQVDKSRAAGSSGLGLAISYEIVQAQGGRCWVESRPEAGTTFFVTLPATSSQPAGTPQVGSPAASQQVVVPVGSATTTR